MRRVMLISLALVLALVGWSTVGADDGFYVIPSVKKSPPVVVNAGVPKTGQTNSYGSAGSDGALQRGVAWPTPRLTDNGNGTVTDNLTGLVWTKRVIGEPSFGFVTWGAALSYANTLASGIAGLTDGSKAGDWRLPNIRELKSLLDYGRHDPALPLSHPFQYIEPATRQCWTSTTYAGNTNDTNFAWYVHFADGTTSYINKVAGLSVLCVRGGP